MRRVTQIFVSIIIPFFFHVFISTCLDSFPGTSVSHLILILSPFPMATSKIPLILVSSSHEFPTVLTVLFILSRILGPSMLMICFFIFYHSWCIHLQVPVPTSRRSMKSSFCSVAYHNVLSRIDSLINLGVINVAKSTNISESEEIFV